MELGSIGFIAGLTIMVLSIVLLVIIPHPAITNPYPPYLCHGNITNTTNITAACYNNPQYQNWEPPIPESAQILMGIFGAGMIIMVVSILFSKEEDIWN